MLIFNSTLSQLLMMLSLVAAGIFIRKKKLIPSDSHMVMSKLETLVFLPALNFSTQLAHCSFKSLSENAELLLYGALLSLIPIAISFPLSKPLMRKRESSPDTEYERNVYKYGLSFANYGFIGNFIILSVWGDALFYKYSLFTLVVGFVCVGYGLYLLIPKEKGAGPQSNIKKALLSPPLVAMVLGMVVGLLDLGRFVPEFLNSALNSAASCMGPVAMLITGFVIGGYEIAPLLTDKRNYVVTALRLIIIPAFILSLLKLCGANDDLLILALVLFGSPIGLNSIIFPAAYGGDTRPGASMVLISQLFSVATIPTLYLVFVELI